jgi:hypothetical protein
MHSLGDSDSYGELALTEHGSHARSEVLDVDGPRLSLRIKFGSGRGQVNDRRRVRKLEQLSAKPSLNRVAVWRQMRHLPVLLGAHLTDDESRAYEQCLHKSI